MIAGPLGGVRGDINAGMVAATIVNAFRENDDPVDPVDFLPDWNPAPDGDEEVSDGR